MDTEGSEAGEYTEGMSTAFYLGLDGGGTKTSAAIVDASGFVLARGEGGAANLATTSTSTAEHSVRQAAVAALQSAGFRPDATLEAVGAGMAGFVVREQRAGFLELLRNAVQAKRYVVQADYVAAHWGATGGGCGVCVCAGTGAVVYGKNRRGWEARVDGNGFLLGDAGSGFYLGLRALQHTLRYLESGRTLDPLAQTVISTTGARNRDLLVEWAYHPFEPGRIAQLATLVGRLADDGAPGARQLLRNAAGHLWRSTDRVMSVLAEDENLPVYLLGGLWQISPLMREFFLEAARRSTSGREPLVLAEPLYDAAVGAALMAARAGNSRCTAPGAIYQQMPLEQSE